MAPAVAEKKPSPKTAGDVEVSEPRKALVSEWLKKIKDAKEHKKIKKPFDRMKKCMKLATQGTDDDSWVSDGNYVLPIITRHINMTTAQLYARNPTTVVKRKQRLLYTVWDGKVESVNAAIQAAQMGDMSQMPLLQDVLAGQQYTTLLDKTAKTLQICWGYFMDEQEHNYKAQLKAAVRRAKVNGVAYVKLGFQREMELNPEATAGISDITSKIKEIERLIEEGKDPDAGDDSSDIEKLRLNLIDLQNQQNVLVREGPTLSFPRSNAIIFDPATTHLKVWAGTGWVAEEFDKNEEDIEKEFKVSIGEAFTPHTATFDEKIDKDESVNKKTAKVYQVWDRVTRQRFVICEGYPDFIQEPATPPLDIERFFPYFPLVFNEVESDDDVIPPSDVWLIRHPQMEMNRSRQGIREHRMSNRPFYGVTKGALQENDLKKLGSHAAHEVVEFAGLGPDDDINKKVKKFDHAAIDPKQYDTSEHFNDVLRAVGTQQANLGVTTSSTATESSIAENSRQAGAADSVDDLDDWLSALSKAGGQLMLAQLQKDTVLEIAGPGAVWPDTPESRTEIAKDLALDIEAGSSGRPNRTAELADMERAAPTLTQLPGVNPAPFVKKYLSVLGIDLEEGIAEGLPSVTAINAIISRGPPAQGAPGAAGTPSSPTDPKAQGAAGAQNAPQTPGGQPGSQAPFPAPGQGTAPMSH